MVITKYVILLWEGGLVEIAYRVSYNDWFLREIAEKGEVLHGTDAYCNIKNLKDTHCRVNVLRKEKDCMNPLTTERRPYL